MSYKIGMREQYVAHDNHIMFRIRLRIRYLLMCGIQMFDNLVLEIIKGMSNLTIYNFYLASNCNRASDFLYSGILCVLLLF